MDPLSITASTLTIVGAISKTYETIKTIKGLPKAFDEVGCSLPLVCKILKEAETRLGGGKDDSVDEENEAISGILQTSNDKATELEKIFTKIKIKCDEDQQAQDWKKRYLSVYRKALRGLKASKVEKLMADLLDALDKMIKLQVFRSASQSDLQDLEGAVQNAIQKLANTEPSITDAELETGHTQIVSGESATGNQYNMEGENFVHSTQNNYATHSTGATLNIGNHIHYPQKRENDNRRRILRDLCVTDPRHDRERIVRSKDALLRECYSWILDDVTYQRWLSLDGPRLLWIKGDPGKGKTMMTVGLIGELEKEGTSLVSYFFCENAVPQLNSAIAILRGLIYMLISQADKSLNLMQYIEQKYNDAGGRMLFEGINAIHALQQILSDILNDVSLPTAYVLIDALDECTSGLAEILHVVTEKSLRGLSKVKWLVTSRNTPEINGSLMHRTHDFSLSLELNADHVSKAVETFVNFKMELLTVSRGYDPELAIEVKQKLLEKADGTFLWVWLACKELQHIELYLTREVIDEMQPGLDPLYGRMMNQIFALDSRRNSRTSQFCLAIIHSATLAYRPLQLQEVPTVAGLPKDQFRGVEDIQDVIMRCGSFLTIRNNALFFVHLSARDYFTTGKGKQLLGVPVAEPHAQLSDRLLDALDGTLRRNICNLQGPGTRIKDALHLISSTSLPRIKYACEFWVQHVQALATHQDTFLVDDGKVHRFLQKHFLHWLEAMSLFQKVPDALGAMRKLELMLKKLESRTLSQINPALRVIRKLRLMLVKSDRHALSEFTHDTVRFMMHGGQGIQEAPLQIYWGALLFAPRNSVVRKQFATEMPDCVEILSGLDEDWGSLLQTLEGHTEAVKSVAFSAQGHLLASGSIDRTVRVWDTETGRLLHTLVGHTGSITSVAFSPKVKNLLASSSNDYTVRLWNPETGKFLRSIKRHPEPVMSVCFLIQGQLVSTSRDGSVIWDAENGKLLRVLLYQFNDLQVIASPEDALLATVRPKSNLVHILKCNNGQLLHMLSHSRQVTYIAFTARGNLISISEGQNLQVWNIITGQMLQQIDNFSSSSTITCSPQGSQMASVDKNGQVDLWEMKNWLRLRSLTTSNIRNYRPTVVYDPADRLRSLPTYNIRNSRPAVVYNPAGNRLAVSEICTIKLWETEGIQARLCSTDHAHGIAQLSFSPQGERLASLLVDGTLRLHDTYSGQLIWQATKAFAHFESGNRSPLFGPPVRFAFSPHGDRAAVIDLDQDMINIWDTQSGDKLIAFQHDEKGFIGKAIFEQNRILLVREFSEHDAYETVQRIQFSSWDVETGEMLHRWSNLGEPHERMTHDSIHKGPARKFILETSGTPCSVQLAGVDYLEKFSREPKLGRLGVRPGLDWITMDGEDRIWLPAEYYGEKGVAATSENVVALGTSSCRLVLIKFR